MDRLISEQAVIESIEFFQINPQHFDFVNLIDDIKDIPSAEPRWIPVSERLPEDLEPVNITWVNHEPEPYYHDIKDRNFVATGIYYRGQWYWYSTTCADYLGEYGSNEIDKVDDAVEIIAWMPLPEPYKAESKVIERNLCDSCTNKGCIFQYGIVRSHCDFYKAESEDKK